MTWKSSLAALAAAALALLAPPAHATCADGSFEGIAYTACAVDPAAETLRLWHMAPDGLPWGTFQRLAEGLAAEGRTLGFAMNGAMYHPDRAPVGYYVEDGAEIGRLVARAGPGNFGMLPNGVLCLTPGRAEVVETGAFAASGRSCAYAMQSGPLMVENGRLHPRFRADSASRFVRNGVGVRPDGTAVFAISNAPVTFHAFARLFRDGLGAPDALFIDGNVSRLYAPELDRHDLGFPMGPIVGTVRPAPAAPTDPAD